MSDVKMTPKEQAYVDELTAILKRMPRNVYLEIGDWDPYLDIWKRVLPDHKRVARVRIRSGQ